jgi:hypothetical protein
MLSGHLEDVDVEGLGLFRDSKDISSVADQVPKK